MKKWIIRPVLIMFGLAVTLMIVAIGGYRLVNQTNGSLVSSGEKRTYLLYVPESYDPSIPTSLVISLHAFAEWPAHLMQMSGWNDLADQYGFIVVYPSGTGFPLRWRYHSSPGDDVDTSLDILFIQDLIDQLASQYNLDSERIYVNGMSNGGGMSFVLSCQLSERITAIGSVSGAYLYSWDDCNPSQAIPAIVFHGTEDAIVPYQGGPSRSFEVPFPNITQWISTLAQRNCCNQDPQEIPISEQVNGLQYRGCEAEVVFYTITGGGHTWPGGQPLPEFITGHTTQDVNATQLMWDFFQQHP
jgi:polyhydroxybutyrate depolymerase